MHTASWSTVYGVVVIALTTLAACSNAQEQVEPSEQILTTVNGEQITVKDFETSYVEYLIATGQNDTARLRYQYLSSLIDASLLADEALDRGYDADTTFRVLLERAKQRAIGGRYFQSAFVEKLPPIEDQEVREAFVKSKQQVVVRHLFYTQKSSADSAYARLQAGRDFLEEAMDCYNLPAVDSAAGMLGPVRYFQVDDAFAETAFSLEVGSFSPPVRSALGYHIIRAEEKFGTPIITESEYQTRRGGISNNVAQRKLRLQGGQFVRGFMEGLHVELEPFAVDQLSEALDQLENRVAPDPVELNVERGDGESGAEKIPPFTPETVLATYEFGGETVSFTALDYYFWLPELSFQEARSRPAASLGRALRNDALYRAGVEADLEDDPIVKGDVAWEARRALTRLMRDSLAAEAPASIPEADLRVAFERSPLARTQLWDADFWVISDLTREDAESIKGALEAQRAVPSYFQTHQEYKEQALNGVPQWASLVKQAPLGETMLVQHSVSGWGLLHVSRREVQEPSFKVLRDSLETSLLPRYAEYQLLQHLYESAVVETDTLLFEEIMVR